MDIQITAQPWSLLQLEALCATARAQGFPDGAKVNVSLQPQSVKVSVDAEDIQSLVPVQVEAR